METVRWLAHPEARHNRNNMKRKRSRYRFKAELHEAWLFGRRAQMMPAEAHRILELE
jgi:hypothetical protein